MEKTQAEAVRTVDEDAGAAAELAALARQDPNLARIARHVPKDAWADVAGFFGRNGPGPRTMIYVPDPDLLFRVMMGGHVPVFGPV